MTDHGYPTGWLHRPNAVRDVIMRMPRPHMGYFCAAAPDLIQTGRDCTSLAYKAWKDVLGQYPVYPKQEIGDCTSHATAHGVDLIECVRIAISGSAEIYRETATEPIYAMSRVDVGDMAGSYEDGSVAAWTAQAVTKCGTLTRDDVGPYSGSRARAWGADGVPEPLKSQAATHKVKTAALVLTYQDLCNSLANLYPVVISSSVGFSLERDAQGFCTRAGQWDHCMLAIAIRAGDRPGCCIFQSWGPDVPKGPLDLDQPSNSFWVDRTTVEDMLGYCDSWSLSGFDGYPQVIAPGSWTYRDFV